MTQQNVKKPVAVKVVLDIKPGLLSPAQKTAWRRFWARLIHEAIEKTPASADNTTGAIKEDNQNAF